MGSLQQQHFTRFPVASQQLHLALEGGRIVGDAGRLAVRALEKPLRVHADRAQPLPDPRSPKALEHSAEALRTQALYQIRAGSPDGNHAQQLGDDPLFPIRADLSPDADHPLARGSTLARVPYADTRRQAELALPERSVVPEVRAAQTGRIKIRNHYRIERLIRRRRTPPEEIILDVDAREDPLHGHQTLSGAHGYYRPHPYLPWFVYDGASGFPLAAWLRPGAVPARLGAVALLDARVSRLRAAGPGIRLQVRSDNGLAVPEVQDDGEAHRLPSALGYARNPVLPRATEQALADGERYHHVYGRREPVVQRLESVADYQAESWTPPRRMVAQIEVTPQGSQRPLVLTNLPEETSAVYRDFDVQGGKVPEPPIGALTKGLRAERLSACGFCANAFRLRAPRLAQAIVVRFGEAAASVPEVATARVSTLRQRRWKVGAVVVTGVRRIGCPFSQTWPYRGVWCRVLSGVDALVARMSSA